MKQFYSEVGVDTFMCYDSATRLEVTLYFSPQKMNKYYGISCPPRQDHGWPGSVQRMKDAESLEALCGLEHN